MSMPAQLISRSAGAALSRLGDYIALTKPVLLLLMLVTVASGYALGTDCAVDPAHLAQVVLAVGLVAGGAAALNQYAERHTDAKMDRTRQRPLPTGRLASLEALVFGAACCAAGTAWLWAVAAPLPAGLGMLSLGLYLFAYTPLKFRTPLNTLVGAVVGALPPVIGWTAATGALSAGAGALFAILFVWQLAHFYVIAWLYRDDYARAGIKMLSVMDDARGTRTVRQIVGACAVMILVSQLPVMAEMAGGVYLIAAALLSAAFLAHAIALALRRSRASARRFFWASIIYLPCLLGFMILDRLG